jgi:hypothetical protein
MDRARLRRIFIGVCLGAVLSAIVLALTSGISLPLGPMSLPLRSPLVPLVIAIVSGLIAWVLAMPASSTVGPQESVSRPVRRRGAVALLVCLVLGLNVLMLAQPPLATDRDYCMSETRIGKGFRHIIDCDSFLFLILAKTPSEVLTEGIRHSRPLAFVLPHLIAQPLYLVPRLEKYGPYRPRAPEFVAFLIVNLVLLTLTVLAFAWVLNGGPSLSSSPELLFGAVLLGVNDITKIYFWAPHTQIYNLFVPALSMYLVYRAAQRGEPMRALPAAALGLALGIGLLAYGSFLIPVSCLAGVQLFMYRRPLPAFLIAVLPLLPYLLWVRLVTHLTGYFHFAETVQFRQFVWMLDCAGLGAVACTPIVTANLSAFFTTVAPVMLVPLTLLFGLWLAAGMAAGRPEDRPRRVMTKPAALAIGTTFAVTLVFLALMGFYRPRLAWMLFPPLALALAIELRTWRLATAPAGWWQFNWLVLAVCLFYVAVLLVRQGPYG